MTIAKPWYTSWTVWLNILGIVALVLEPLVDQGLSLGLPPQVVLWIGFALTIVNLLLRVLRTSQPLSIAGSVPSAPTAPH